MWFALLTLLLIQLFAIYLFSTGFFIYKKPVADFATFADYPYHNNHQIIPKQHYDRYVMMVVDALRQDFVFGPDSKFDFLREMIATNRSMPFLGKAQAPTVTMPRIKALTAGNIPGFLDFILNIESSALKDDNWVSQMKRDDRRIKFYGDDTWMRLFPNHFTESDGTVSFYVTDTVEVDRNVTRHLPGAVEKDDWDAIVLHYLGLDHIGHLQGPRSELMPEKQREMDAAVKMIYEALVQVDKRDGKSSLFLICGDHGMTDIGNHGGSSFEEISTAAVFLSPQFEAYRTLPDKVKYLRSINQIDLVPTLSTMLGLPIPINSSGALITEFFQDLTELKWALFVNVEQMYQLFSRSFKIEQSGTCQLPCQVDIGDKEKSLKCLQSVYIQIKKDIEKSDDSTLLKEV